MCVCAQRKGDALAAAAGAGAGAWTTSSSSAKAAKAYAGGSHTRQLNGALKATYTPRSSDYKYFQQMEGIWWGTRTLAVQEVQEWRENHGKTRRQQEKEAMKKILHRKH